ncbi:transcriptional attenuator, LytR family [[Leptolyngbya] sp. PCC 7376]|uniref:LCP family protein n=1 Tax=[Leptolyngbya] sp. PCC 7376 TaxID=111781 RepID=UPI00029F3A9F|nr:LCP family protein [[Leptolyngbya] sp. PCC 7376]AFY39807.1 transcriptional attenuator, LytR family [[Leptolyngbya] sp. PCC 7376]
MTRGQEVKTGEQVAKASTKLLGKQQRNADGGRKLSFLLKGFLWGSGFMGTTLLSAAVGTWLALYTPLSQIVLPFLPSSLESLKQEGLQQLGSYSLGRPVNILVMGIDRVEGTEGSEIFGGRSDTMLLVRFDPELENKRVNMLSIPRDTQVLIPDVGLTKVNDANVYGGGKLAAEVVSETLNDVPVDRYVRITTDTFRELVDAVGGVNVFVPYDMKYKDETQDLEIDLEEGWQVLDGDQAEQFARFRNDEFGDIGRVQRQQVLLKALREKVQSPAIIPRLPNLISLVQEHIDTDLSWEEMLALMNFSRQLEKDHLNMVMLPGRFSDAGEYNRSYWLVSNQEKNRVMQDFFGVEPPLQVLGDGESGAIAPQRLRIAIQNATNENGIAGQMSRYLMTEDFTNTYLARDYSDILDHTQIIVQRGDLEAANLLLDVIGVGRVEASSIGEIESDITIRVGRDWLEAMEETE